MAISNDPKRPMVRPSVAPKNNAAGAAAPAGKKPIDSTVSTFADVMARVVQQQALAPPRELGDSPLDEDPTVE